MSFQQQEPFRGNQSDRGVILKINARSITEGAGWEDRQHRWRLGKGKRCSCPPEAPSDADSGHGVIRAGTVAEGVQEGLMLGDWDQKFWWVAGRAWLPLDSPINTISGVAQTPRLTRVSQTMCKEVPTECWRSEVLLRIQTGYAEKQNKTRGKDWETRHTQAPKYSTGQRPVCAAYMLQAVNSQMRKKYSFCHLYVIPTV